MHVPKQHDPKHRVRGVVAPEALRPREVTPEETIRRVLHPRRSRRVDLVVLLLVLVVGGMLVGAVVEHAITLDRKDQLVAAEMQVQQLDALVTGLEASSLYDAAGLYTSGRESGGLSTARPVADATGLFTAAREGGMPLEDPSGLFTGAREGP